MIGMPKEGNDLPIAAIAEDVCRQLDVNPRLVVTAPPGAGKSTLLPIALMHHIANGKIIMLEPRRIAARQVAIRMAEMLGQRVGQNVGYCVRFESRISPQTRIEVMTDGVLERKLIEDPTLDGVQAVIFDEFHERSLASDLNLALTLEIQRLIRPDLKILVMSATIDADDLCKRMDAGRLHCDGQNYPVDINHGNDFDMRDCALEVARAVAKASKQGDGDILAFLPGQAEILKCKDLLSNSLGEIEISVLYGQLPPDEQRKALSPSSSGKRRIYLASPIAETSLTIPGITIVVDSGLYRVPVFDSAVGLNRLVTSRISLDMAIQRTGRAGRLSPGVCYRLWTKATESRMQAARRPEIQTADLTSMVLSVAAWGERNPISLPWITPPADSSLSKAGGLLRMLGAVDPDGSITAKGEKIALLPCHPRIANMLLEAREQKSLAADIAAILEDRDPISDEKDSDMTTRIALLSQYRHGNLSGGWLRLDQMAAQYRRLVGAKDKKYDFNASDIGRLLSSAYPERIAMQTDDNAYRLAGNGDVVLIHPDDDLARHRFLSIASMGKKVHLAAPIEAAYIESLGQWRVNVCWDSRESRVVAREELRLGALLIASRPHPIGEIRERIIEAIAAAAPKEGLSIFDFNDKVKSLQIRLATVDSWHPDLGLPDVSTENILYMVADWLPMYIGKATTSHELKKIDLTAVIFGLLTYEQQQAVDRIAPTHIKLPGGKTARIHYRKGAEAPIVSAKLQDCFGLAGTPLLDDGKRPVLMELLSPGFKPVQLTQDLEGFWQSTYFEVRKELRRRYPKHPWPDNPNGLG